MVTLSGIWAPLSSSPTTIGTVDPGRSFLTSCPLFGREKSNCLISVTRNVCISRSLSVTDKPSVNPFTSDSETNTHANLHPMQFLGPPENVALYGVTSNPDRRSERKIKLHTGCHRRQMGIWAFQSLQAIVLVGIHKRLAPTGLCPCKIAGKKHQFL